MRLIDADELEEKLLNMVDLHSEIDNPMAIILLQVFIDIVKKMDTVKAESMRYGKWIRSGGNKYPVYTCSECGSDNNIEMPYCAYCGIKMDGDDEND
ncbi:MAG: hypothetical protein K2O36_05455 [Ruminococcus sp.]|nr:hypothetical protein [Ruminococcus sp.]